jgi:hypothetical protein
MRGIVKTFRRTLACRAGDPNGALGRPGRVEIDQVLLDEAPLPWVHDASRRSVCRADKKDPPVFPGRAAWLTVF